MRLLGDENRDSPVESIFVCGFYVGDLIDGFGWMASWVGAASTVRQKEMCRAAIDC
jgi:hypothetical protein